MKRPGLQNKQVGVLRMAFRPRKVFRTFEKRAPGHIRFPTYESFFFVFFFFLLDVFTSGWVEPAQFSLKPTAKP